VSVEKIRKLRLFQPDEYISLDYTRQDASRIRMSNGEAHFDSLPAGRAEPLELELRSFLESVRTRRPPVVSGEDATRALRVSLDIIDRIEEHGAVVSEAVAAYRATTGSPVSS
jgi:predicted dehydrogenase